MISSSNPSLFYYSNLSIEPTLSPRRIEDHRSHSHFPSMGKTSRIAASTSWPSLEWMNPNCLLPPTQRNENQRLCSSVPPPDVSKKTSAVVAPFACLSFVTANPSPFSQLEPQRPMRPSFATANPSSFSQLEPQRPMRPSFVTANPSSFSQLEPQRSMRPSFATANPSSFSQFEPQRPMRPSFVTANPSPFSQLEPQRPSEKEHFCFSPPPICISDEISKGLAPTSLPFSDFNKLSPPPCHKLISLNKCGENEPSLPHSIAISRNANTVSPLSIPDQSSMDSCPSSLEIKRKKRRFENPPQTQDQATLKRRKVNLKETSDVDSQEIEKIEKVINGIKPEYLKRLVCLRGKVIRAFSLIHWKLGFRKVGKKLDKWGITAYHVDSYYKKHNLQSSINRLEAREEYIAKRSHVLVGIKADKFIDLTEDKRVALTENKLVGLTEDKRVVLTEDKLVALAEDELVGLTEDEQVELKNLIELEQLYKSNLPPDDIIKRMVKSDYKNGNTTIAKKCQNIGFSVSSTYIESRLRKLGLDNLEKRKKAQTEKRRFYSPNTFQSCSSDKDRTSILRQRTLSNTLSP